MRRSPSDPTRRAEVKRAVASCVETGEGYYLIGFDWRPHYSVPGHEAFDRTRLAVRKIFAGVCFRAIVRVTEHGNGVFTAVLLDIGGEATYALNVRGHAERWKQVWVSPDPLQVLEMESLQADHNHP